MTGGDSNPWDEGPSINRAAGDVISHQREVRPLESQRFDRGCRRLVRPAVGFLVQGHASLACSFQPQIPASAFLVADFPCIQLYARMRYALSARIRRRFDFL